MQSKAATVEEYLQSLPAVRREALQVVRDTIRRNLDSGYAEGMQYGMIGYFVPHSVFPPGYHCDPRQPLPFAGLASQKHKMSLYLMCVYGHEGHLTWFREAWAKTGKKLDMGKACIRFSKVEDLALDVIAEAIRRTPSNKYVAFYVKSRADHSAGKQRRPAKAGPSVKAAAKRVVPGKAAAKKKLSKKTTARSRAR